MLLLMGPEEWEIKVSATFKLALSATTNEFHLENH